MSFARARRRDGNHAEIVRALVARGCTVLDLSAIGTKGVPDLLVAWSGRMVLMEIKNPAARGHVAAHQQLWHMAWKGPPVVVVRSVEEALAATGVG